MQTNSSTPSNHSEPSSEPALLDVNAVSKLCSCSTRTIRRLADAGSMPRPVKLGALVRWRRTDIQDWLQAGCPNLRARTAR